jgi:hypothetical protein
MKRLLLVGALVAVCAGAVHVGSAKALAACGTINASTTLAADCAAPLTVGTSGITVDLGGHTIRCDSATFGIVIPDPVSNVTVKNGTVRGGLSSCIEDVEVRGDSNQVTSVRAFDASAHGFFVIGDSNTLLLITGNFNDDGGVIVLGDDNLIRQGTFAANGDDGAEFFLGTGNAITRSRSFLNDDKGIIVGASATAVTENHSFFNDVGLYFSDGSVGSTAVLNQTYQNDIGIWVNGTSKSNSIVFNGSYANFNLDMEDDNANCDSNLWFNNLFSTANQSCIR